ncbi:putative bifunctional diguanylate cyclase/phosphodiesterase [Pseudomonas jilinensis]|uniref:cyclic-guanylate-specific phosphodiesterase n=1 Tax=Pseudomonas jilinensis TaxID=2078689 RepID=A0A396SB48_9PSED|nr:EAL domain-containing protein [Pseudomonas jilinensis]RHW20675.1 GGDEF domain-containing protein [Pseudomonas jilinensis]
MTSSRSAWHITLIYLVVSVLWILFSDQALVLLGLDEQAQRRLQTYKGLMFVGVTATLIFFVVRGHLRRLQQQGRALRRSEERFDLALSGANDGVWDWDFEAGRGFFSSRCKAIVGYPADAELDVRQIWIQRLHPSDRDAAVQVLRAHLLGDIPRYNHTHRIRHTEGHFIWIQASGRVIRDEQGQPQRIVGIVRDVTELKSNEERLRQAAVVFDSTKEGVVITDARNRILNVNQAFCRITGYSREQVLGQNPGFLKSGRHNHGFYRELWAKLQATGSWQGEIWNRRKDSEIYPQWQTINAVYDSDGRLTHYVAVFTDLSQLKRSQQEVDFLAHHDPLTRLPNRLLIMERLNNAVLRARRHSHRLGLISIDLDRFKNVNDSLGHSAGDELLRIAAERMTGVCREEDTLARLGGDEFVLLVDQLDQVEDLALIAGRIQQAFAQPFEIDGQRIHLTVSLGLSVFPDDCQDAGDLLKNADTAVSQAKNSGRNSYAFYTQALTEQARRQLALESNLHQALAQQQLQVYYQPLIALHSGRLSGFEALVRWQHPELGMVAPDEFLPVAQRAGLMGLIDEYVLSQACRQMRTWLDAGYQLDTMAVNMSGYWLERGQVLGSVEQALHEAGLAADYLELEVTESEIMQHGEQCIELLDALRQRGVRLSIDDFGTGYSSLLRLKRLPVNKLKIDRGFIVDLPGDSNDSAIARAIIALAQSLQLQVTAEGIETEAQQTLLRELGCDIGQGYFFSRPLPAQQLQGLLQGTRIEA